MILKIRVEELREIAGRPSISFPKYVAQLLNLANQNAQGTRPKIVGQMSELIEQFGGKSLDEWERWYLTQKPEAIDRATQQVWTMVQALKHAIHQVDESMVRA
jgi:hypothetical protein